MNFWPCPNQLKWHRTQELLNLLENSNMPIELRAINLVWFGFVFLLSFSFVYLSAFENGKTKDRAGKLCLNGSHRNGVKIVTAGAISM